MMPLQFRVRDLLEATVGDLLQGHDQQLGITGISTDTRTLKCGQAYLALKGPQFDGHEFVVDACASGAAVLIVDSTSRLPEAPELDGVPIIGVQDTLEAYGAIARWHRRRFDIPIVAITGSCGKTTTKEYLSVLLSGWSVLKNPHTENNAIGVPRALLQLTEAHEVGIIEVGSNHPGEVAYLRDIVEPTHVIVTNIGPAHLEFFHTVESVADEKLSLLQSVPASGGIVLNADDHWMSQWRAAQQGRQPSQLMTFGLGAEAQVRMSDYRCDGDGTRFMINGRYQASLPTVGTHHAMDAIAAVACAVQLGCSFDDVVPALERCGSMELRMECIRFDDGPILLSDCYNANPLSMAQAIHTLAQFPNVRRRILVAGEMRELGDFTTTAHCEVGQWAMQAHLDGVIAVGPYASLVLAGAQTMIPPRAVSTGRSTDSSQSKSGTSATGGGMMQHTALLMAYQTVEEACTRVPDILRRGDLVLIKGSRGAQLERLVASCRDRWGTTDAVLAQQPA